VFWRNGGDGESYVCVSVFKLLARIALNSATIFSIAQTVHERHGAVENTGVGGCAATTLSRMIT
jgi:hypothetical protein